MFSLRNKNIIRNKYGDLGTFSTNEIMDGHPSTAKVVVELGDPKQSEPSLNVWNDGGIRPLHLPEQAEMCLGKKRFGEF